MQQHTSMQALCWQGAKSGICATLPLQVLDIVCRILHFLNTLAAFNTVTFLLLFLQPIYIKLYSMQAAPGLEISVAFGLQSFRGCNDWARQWSFLAELGGVFAHVGLSAHRSAHTHIYGALDYAVGSNLVAVGSPACSDAAGSGANCLSWCCDGMFCHSSCCR
jgi:hypothetical protein